MDTIFWVGEQSRVLPASGERRPKQAEKRAKEKLAFPPQHQNRLRAERVSRWCREILVQVQSTLQFGPYQLESVFLGLACAKRKAELIENCGWTRWITEPLFDCILVVSEGERCVTSFGGVLNRQFLIISIKWPLPLNGMGVEMEKIFRLLPAQ